jgi:hypothetical protein
VSPVKYELGFYIPEAVILYSHCRENLKFYILNFTNFIHYFSEKLVASGIEPGTSRTVAKNSDDQDHRTKFELKFLTELRNAIE